MKNNFLIKLFIYAIIIAGLFSLNVVYSIENRRLTKTKIELEDSLSLVQNKINEKIVFIQQLSSEDRIVKYSIDTLGLEYNNEGVFEIVIDKQNIKSIEKRVNSIYE